MAALSDRIKESRRVARLTQAELAGRVGVQPSAVAQWESTRGTAPTVQNLIKIATVASVSFEWLATGRGTSRRKVHVESTAIRVDDFAHNEFEEQMLMLARQLPTSLHQPLTEFLNALTKRRK